MVTYMDAVDGDTCWEMRDQVSWCVDFTMGSYVEEAAGLEKQPQHLIVEGKKWKFKNEKLNLKKYM